MKSLITTTIVTVALTCATAYAGGNHSHEGEHGHGHSHTQIEVSKSTIEQTAVQELAGLVQQKKIDESWKNTPISTIEKKKFHHNMEWVVSFKNKELKDKTKQTIYVFISLYGKPTGANYTGK